jgi:6-phosphogluconolactonase
MSQVRIFNETDELYRAAAERIAHLSQLAVAREGRFALLLAGGNTPRRLYTLLASPGYSIHIDWANTHLFWGDERAVPLSDPKSNYRMVSETLLSRVAVPWQNIHRIEGELPPEEAAERYEEELRQFFQTSRVRIADCGLRISSPRDEIRNPQSEIRDSVGPAQPEGYATRFDLALLGLGADGHAASLFPGSPALQETARLAVAVPEADPPRVTLTLPAFNACAEVLFLVAGAAKAPALAAVLEGPPDLVPPAGRVRPQQGEVLWLVDQAAAALLQQRSHSNE